MTKKFLTLFMIILLLIPIASYTLLTKAESKLNENEIDAYITSYLKRNGLPGASIVIVKDGKTVYEKGYGHDSNGKPLSNQSLMRIASVSKSFTAFSVLQLVEAGKINLEDKLVSHLPELIMDDTRLANITIRHLLSHTSGIPNPTIIAPANNLKEGISRLHNWKLNWEPGTKYLYSNANYWILARLIEVVSNMEYPEYLKEKIFKPLGMENTLSAINSDEVVKGLAKGYITAYGTALPWTELKQMFAGAGGIISTASDMGKWLSMHTNGGISDKGERILSAELLKESYLAQDNSPKYGLGWSISSPNVTPARISHSGMLSTAQAQQDIIPSTGYGVAVILNSFTTTFEHAYEISSGIIKITEGEKAEVKRSMPIVIDFVLGLITVVSLYLSIKGIKKSKEWVKRRKHYPAWKFYLRLTPQLITTLMLGWLFFIVPTLQNNSSTIKDAFGIWLPAMILLAIVFINGLAVTVMRVYYRVR